MDICKPEIIQCSSHATVFVIYGCFALLLGTERSAHNTVKYYTGVTLENELAMSKRRGRSSKKVRRKYKKKAGMECHERLHNITMQSRDDADDFVHIMDGYRDRTEELGQPVPDRRYEDTILGTLPAKYGKVRIADYERRDCQLVDICYMVRIIYIGYPSRPDDASLVAGRAMQASGRGDSGRKIDKGRKIVRTFHFCIKPGHSRETAPPGE